jgi:hypothetical protein
LIRGQDLIDAGYQPGPAFARILEQVYDAQLEGTVGDHETALRLARTLLGGGFDGPPRRPGGSPKAGGG